MRNFVATKIQELRPSGIRKYFDIAATMDDVVTLGIGEPNFVTPNHIMDAGIDSMRRGETGYTANAGLIELRRAISDYVHRLYRLNYDPKTEVLVTVGVSEGLWLALKAVVEPGDEVLVVEPCFVSNAAAVEMVGGVPVPVHTSVEHEFQVTSEALEQVITPRTKAILISYPNNPTGAVLTCEHMQQVAAIAEKYDLVVISDEIYERLVYGIDHINFATLPGMYERTIVLSGMSKAFAMTGWRIGYVTAPHYLMEAIFKLHQYLIMSAPTMGQRAALEALEHGEDDVQHMQSQYDRRRKLIVDGFNQIGLTCFEPRGAFYAFPDIRVTGMTDEEFCERLLLDARVAVVPGSAFGASGAGFIRASYANSDENIERALERMHRFMLQHG
ncbi:MAG: aminotransferase class I/II-fold pyridoxal phosphate-dependent enzyme [Anaerolineae bacterium]|nr:aminotransferase class I/II-fold pyridoxal phosphate-dependent enzyme [Anaerolineae bacterium]